MVLGRAPTFAQGEWTAAGRYRQKVRLPSRKVIMATGGFDSRWRCDTGNGCKISRLETF